MEYAGGYEQMVRHPPQHHLADYSPGQHFLHSNLGNIDALADPYDVLGQEDEVFSLTSSPPAGSYDEFVRRRSCRIGTRVVERGKARKPV